MSAALLARLCAPLVRLWLRSLRIRVLYPDGACLPEALDVHGNEVGAVCERDLLAGLREAMRLRCSVLVARGRDGDRASALAERLGLKTIRGSSRGGGHEAALQFQRATGLSHPAIVPVDGPLGPAGVAKPGVFAWARATGRTVRPLSCAARPHLRFPFTWSGIYAPLPFARVILVFGPSLPAASSREERTTAAAALSAILADLRSRAERAVRHEPHLWKWHADRLTAEARSR